MTDFQQSLRLSAAARPRVAVVVVHYNNLQQTLECVASVEKSTYRGFFKVIVDNCSPNGSGEVLQKQTDSSTQVLLNAENLGFAAGVNLGLAYALKYDVEFVWLLNPDTEIESDALSELVAYADKHRDIGAFGSKILKGPPSVLGQDQKTIWGVGGMVDASAGKIEMRGAGEIDTGQYDAPALCDYLPGCSVFIRTDVLKTVGLLPEEYFMYFEETEWCCQARKTGVRLAVVPSSVVWHNFESEKMREPFTVYYYNRNSYLFWFRRLYGFARVRLVLKVCCRELPQAINALLHSPNAELAAVFRAHVFACIDFLLGRFGRRF